MVFDLFILHKNILHKKLHVLASSTQETDDVTNSFLYIRNNRSFFLPEYTKSAFIRLHTIMVVPSLYGRITTFLPWIYSLLTWWLFTCTGGTSVIVYLISMLATIRTLSDLTWWRCWNKTVLWVSELIWYISQKQLDAFAHAPMLLEYIHGRNVVILVFISHYFRSHMSFKRILCFIRLLTLRMAVPLYCENSFRRCHTITNSFLYIRNNRSFFLPEYTKSAFMTWHGGGAEVKNGFRLVYFT
jgi:hypothetical protein